MRQRKEIEEEMEVLEMEMKSNRHILIPLLHTTVQTELLLDIRDLLKSIHDNPTN